MKIHFCLAIFLIFLVSCSEKKKEIVIKVYCSSKLQNSKMKNFKLVIKGEISLEFLNSFVSLDVSREGNSLKLLDYQVVEKNLPKNN